HAIIVATAAAPAATAIGVSATISNEGTREGNIRKIGGGRIWVVKRRGRLSVGWACAISL
ncbi:unnamed protein product, partial [Sphenostylis stenocarpa]